MRFNHYSCQMEYLLELGEEHIVRDFFSKENAGDDYRGSNGMNSEESCNEVVPGSNVFDLYRRFKETLESLAPSTDFCGKFWLLCS